MLKMCLDIFLLYWYIWLVIKVVNFVKWFYVKFINKFLFRYVFYVYKKVEKMKLGFVFLD